MNILDGMTQPNNQTNGKNYKARKWILGKGSYDIVDFIIKH